jgi:hypothetical protein
MVNDILKVKVHGGSHTSLVTNGLIKLMSFLIINISKDNMAIHYTFYRFHSVFYIFIL